MLVVKWVLWVLSKILSLIIFFCACYIFYIVFKNFVYKNIYKRIKYYKSEYYLQTKNKYSKVMKNQYFSNDTKGRNLEYCIFNTLKPLEGYKKFLFNCYLPKDNGGTTEIDLILLHTSGIYVFEAKNWSGEIYGTETDDKFTVRYNENKQVENPLTQNKIHVKWLKSFLADDTLPFYSYIVFGNNAKLMKIELTTDKHMVVKLNKLLCKLKEHATSNKIKSGKELSENEINVLYKKLYSRTQVSGAEKLKHNQYIQDNKNKCPFCHKELVERLNKKEDKKFLGCPNYPKCKYTKSI